MANHRPSPTPIGGPTGVRWISVDSDHVGRRAVRPTRVLACWLVPFAVVVATSTTWAQRHIETELSARVVRAVATGFGIAVDDDQIEFDGRDGVVHGVVLPDGVHATDVEAYLSSSDAGGLGGALRRISIVPLDIAADDALRIDRSPSHSSVVATGS